MTIYRIVLRALAAVLVLALVIGWGIDRMRWQTTLQVLDAEVQAKETELHDLQARLRQIETFDGFDSVEEVLSVMQHTHPEHVFEHQASSLTSIDDTVYHAIVPRLIEMLDHDEQQMRQRAWRLLQNARDPARFQRYESDYRVGLAKLLQHRSIVGFNKLLPWIRKEKITDEAILAGLRSRMMDDEDPFAPFAAYTLIELDPSVDIAPRLVEMIERKHSQWRAILHRLPQYMPKEEADALFEKYEDYRRVGKAE